MAIALASHGFVGMLFGVGAPYPRFYMPHSQVTAIGTWFSSVFSLLFCIVIFNY